MDAIQEPLNYWHLWAIIGGLIQDLMRLPRRLFDIDQRLQTIERLLRNPGQANPLVNNPVGHNAAQQQRQQGQDRQPCPCGQFHRFP